MLSTLQSLFAPPGDLLLVLLSAWVGLSLAERRASRSPINLDRLSNLILWSLVGFLAGGRVFFAVEHLSAFLPSPLSLFALSPSMFDPWGGLAIALVVAYAYGQRNHLPLWPALDALTPFLASLSVGLALSHLASGQAFGQATTVPWAIEQWGALRHPTQIYETLAALATLIVVLLQKSTPPYGRQFFLFAALTATSRLIIEGFRGDSLLVFQVVRLAQIIAWICLAGALVGLDWTANQAKPMSAPAPLEGEGSGHKNRPPRNLPKKKQINKKRKSTQNRATKK